MTAALLVVTGAILVGLPLLALALDRVLPGRRPNRSDVADVGGTELPTASTEDVVSVG